MAILLDEPEREACLTVLALEDEVFMSAGTLAEAYIVAISRNIGTQLVSLVEEMQIDIVPMDADFAYQAGEAYRYWGKGRHVASLNYGDCFSFAAAKHLGCPLLFIGNDFARTDLASALG